MTRESAAQIAVTPARHALSLALTTRAALNAAPVGPVTIKELPPNDLGAHFSAPATRLHRTR